MCELVYIETKVACQYMSRNWITVRAPYRGRKNWKLVVFSLSSNTLDYLEHQYNLINRKTKSRQHPFKEVINQWREEYIT
jgi:hypothetical protein